MNDNRSVKLDKRKHFQSHKSEKKNFSTLMIEENIYKQMKSIQLKSIVYPKTRSTVKNLIAQTRI